MRLGRAAATLSIAAAMLLAAAVQVAAQVPEVRFARQFSMGYLQFNLMEKHRLLEKHAKAAGIPEVKVVWALYKTLIAAFQEATEMLSKDVKEASQAWLDSQKTKLTLER